MKSRSKMGSTRPPAANEQGLPPTSAQRRQDQIQALTRLRRRVGEQARLLAERDLEARLLRLDIATELRRTGSTKTDGETAAKAHPRYIAHERGTLKLAFARALSDAEAEAVVFQLKAALNESTAATTVVLAVATLLAPCWSRATPPERQALVAEALQLGRLISAAADAPRREPRPAATKDRPPDAA
jgi:hypothetical protein